MASNQNVKPVSMAASMEQGLQAMGLTGLGAIHVNLSPDQLYDEALRRKEVHLSADRAMIALTGQHTSRLPNDNYIVSDVSNVKEIEWSPINQPYEASTFAGLKTRISDWLKTREVFVQD